jgi:hypothetical protein
MKMFMKLISVVFACFVSWLATSTLMGQNRDQCDPGISGVDSVVTQVDDCGDEEYTAKAAKARFDALDEKPIAMGSLDSFAVNVVEGKAVVAAQVSLAESRPGFSYLWRLRILDPGKKVVANRYYDHQIFRMEDDGFMQPTFKEIVELPDGWSYVQLSLFTFPKETDPASLTDEKTAEGFLNLRGVNKVFK